ncbi:hypothetical protein OAT16_06565 [Prolixibacteraceae bacterium]|nr:hypothetical protein [Prolixibacteraceae bacterium]
MKKLLLFLSFLMVISSCEKSETAEPKNNDSDIVRLTKALSSAIGKNHETYRFILDNPDYNEVEWKSTLLYPLLEKTYSSTTLSAELCSYQYMDEDLLKRLLETYPLISVVTYEDAKDYNDEEVLVIEVVSVDPEKVNEVKAYKSDGKVKNIKVTVEPLNENFILLVVGMNHTILSSEEIKRIEKVNSVDLSKYLKASPTLGKYYVPNSILAQYASN